MLQLLTNTSPGIAPSEASSRIAPQDADLLDAYSTAVVAAVERVPQFQGYVQATVQPLVLAGIVLTALATAVLGAIYPARFASTIQPAEALRYE